MTETSQNKLSTRESASPRSVAMENKKIVIESLLTGSQFEVEISDDDKILKIKNQIQKSLGESLYFVCASDELIWRCNYVNIAGIPANQQHLLYNSEEIHDSVVLGDMPSFRDGMKLRLVVSMKVGPIQVSRRLLPPYTGYENWMEQQNAKWVANCIFL